MTSSASNAVASLKEHGSVFSSSSTHVEYAMNNGNNAMKRWLFLLLLQYKKNQQYPFNLENIQS